MNARAPFSVEVSPAGPDAQRVVPQGELDLDTVHAVRQALNKIAARPRVRTVVLDLRQLSFIDSSGLHLVLQADTELRARGLKFALIAGAANVRRPFELAGMTDRLTWIDGRTP